MATVFTSLVPVRRVAVGTSVTAQGRDGTAELARTALESLLSAPWTVSTDAPSFPVHDYDRPLPSGDAWKACYGYDASARNQRGAAGAVCYTFQIPADALTGAACNVSALAFSVVGDRYLDAGVDVHVVLDANAAPPSVATLAARTPDATVCATSSQTEPPNQRHGVTAAVELEPATAATAYLHVALLLHDYLTARGAWIEGGAMLADGEVSITFSRDVAASAQEVVFDAGKGGSGTTDDDDYARAGAFLAPHYRASAYWNALSSANLANLLPLSSSVNPQQECVGVIMSSTADAGTSMKNLETADAAWARRPYSDGASFAKVCYSTDGASVAPSVAYVVRSAYASGRFGALRLSSLATTLPIRVAAYLVEDRIMSITPAASALGDPAFWRGRATAVESIVKFNADGNQYIYVSPRRKDDTYIVAVDTVSIAVAPLASFVVPAGNLAGAYPLDAPCELADTGSPAVLLVAFCPEPGASSDSASVTIPRDLQVSLVRQ